MTIITLPGRTGRSIRRRQRPNPFRDRLSELDIPAIAVPQNKRRVGRRWILALPWIVGGSLAVPLADPAAAQDDSGWHIVEEAWIGNESVPADVVDSGAGQNRILPSLNSWSHIVYERRKPGYEGFTLDGAFILEAYPDDSDLNRWGVDARGEWRKNLDEDRRWQLRLQGQGTFLNDPDEHVFSRIRGGSLLRYRHSAEHFSKGRLTLGYRNQNDDRFDGYDQTEFKAEIGHDWRPGAGRTTLSGWLYGETINAEDDRFSYGGVGVFLWGRVPLNDRLELRGTLSAYSRDYGDQFSALFPAVRKDERFWPRIGLDYLWTEHLILFGNIGYDSNWSNIPTRDYEGVTARIGIRYYGDLDPYIDGDYGPRRDED